MTDYTALLTLTGYTTTSTLAFQRVERVSSHTTGQLLDATLRTANQLRTLMDTHIRNNQTPDTRVAKWFFSIDYLNAWGGNTNIAGITETITHSQQIVDATKRARHTFIVRTISNLRATVKSNNINPQFYTSLLPRKGALRNGADPNESAELTGETLDTVIQYAVAHAHETISRRPKKTAQFPVKQMTQVGKIFKPASTKK